MLFDKLLKKWARPLFTGFVRTAGAIPGSIHLLEAYTFQNHSRSHCRCYGFRFAFPLPLVFHRILHVTWQDEGRRVQHDYIWYFGNALAIPLSFPHLDTESRLHIFPCRRRRYEYLFLQSVFCHRIHLCAFQHCPYESRHWQYGNRHHRGMRPILHWSSVRVLLIPAFV